jgi:hypothetical protein
MCPSAPGGADPWFVNTCQAWREDGPLHRLVQARDEDGLRRLSAFRKPDGASGQERV